MILPKPADLSSDATTEDKQSAIGVIALSYDLTTLQSLDKAVSRATCSTTVQLRGADGKSDKFVVSYQVSPSAEDASSFIVTAETDAAKSFASGMIAEGEPVIAVLADILGPEGSCAAYLQVAIDVLLSHFDRARDALAPFIANPYILGLDQSRRSQDTLGSSIERFGIGDEPSGKVKLADLRGRKSRTVALLDAIPNYQGTHKVCDSGSINAAPTPAFRWRHREVIMSEDSKRKPENGSEPNAGEGAVPQGEPEAQQAEPEMAPPDDPRPVAGDDAPIAPSPAEAGSFPPAPSVAGEFTLPLDQLVCGADHPRGNYDFETGVGKALFHAAVDPAVLTPILVMLIENIWYVVDGWARVMALKLQHDTHPAVLVRVVQWIGTGKEAVFQRFSQTFLTLASKPIESARLLAQMSALWGVPDIVLGARIGWTKSKVSKHLTAAEGDRIEPQFATLLLHPANPPIDYMYRVGRALVDAERDDAKHPRRNPAKGAVASLRKCLEALLAKRERFEPRYALVALGIVAPPPDPELPFGALKENGAATGEPFVLEDMVGHDDVVIGALEMHGDGGRRLLLPDEAAVADLTAVEKATARAVYHEAIDRLFG